MLDFKNFEPDTVKTSVPQKDKMASLSVLSTNFFEEGEGLSEEDRKKLMKQMVALAKKYGDEKRSIKIAENKIKVRKKELRDVEEKLFVMFEACGMSSFGAGAYTFFTRVDSYPSITVEQKAFKWIKEEGFGHIIKLAVNLKTLGSMIKEVFETTGAIPTEDDGIKMRTVNRVGVRKR